jgi:hypothetical protein
MMAALGVLLALLGLAGAVIWWRGLRVPGARAWRHAWGEAGYRASGVWSDFTDWLRSG